MYNIDISDKNMNDKNFVRRIIYFKGRKFRETEIVQISVSRFLLFEENLRKKTFAVFQMSSVLLTITFMNG